MKRKEGIVDYHSYVRINSTSVKYSENKLHLVIDLNNLSGLLIKGIEFKISAVDDFGDDILFSGEKSSMFSLEKLEFEPAMRLRLEYELEADDEPAEIDLRAEMVTFEDGEKAYWQKPKKKIYYYDEIEKDRYKDRLIYEKLSKYSRHPVCFADKRTDGWLCCCGRLNLNKDDLCLECMADRKTILMQCTKEIIKSEIHKEHDDYRKQLHRKREHELLENKKKKRLFIIALILAAALIIAFHVFLYHRKLSKRMIFSDENAMKEYIDGSWNSDEEEVTVNTKNGTLFVTKTGEDTTYHYLIQSYYPDKGLFYTNGSKFCISNDGNLIESDGNICYNK